MIYVYSPLSKEVWKSNFRQHGEMKKQSAGRRVRREKIRRKKMQVREKVGKSRNTCVFSWFCGSGGLKSRLAKAAGAETSGEMRDEKLHAVVVRSTFPSQKVQTHTSSRTTFGSWDVEKVHAVVARSAFPSQNVQKHTILGPLLEVETSKKCKP